MALLIRALLVCSLVGGCLEPDFKIRGKNKDFLVIGHRGAPFEAAENTIASMEAAMDLGANAIETDLCVTQDGEIVVWHDRDPDDVLALGRQEGLEGLPWIPFVPLDGSALRRVIEELTLSDFLAQYGYSRDGGVTRDPDAPIARFADLLEWARHAGPLKTVYLDLKVQDPAVAASILRTVAADAPRDVTWLFLSTRRDVVQALIAEQASVAADEIHVVWDFETEGALAASEDLGLVDVSTGIGIRSETSYLAEIEELVEARRKGRIETVTAWTIDRRQLLGQLLFRDVDGIMTNRPDVLHDLWQLTL